MCPESGFRITPDRPQIAKMTMTLQFVDIKSSLFFWHCFVLLVKFSYWSKFCLNIITGINIIWSYDNLFLYRIDQKLEIPPSEVFSISGDWYELEILNLAWMFLIKCYLKCQGYSFYRFWGIKLKGKTTGGREEGKAWNYLLPPPD